jgi:hypothetical protein
LNLITEEGNPIPTGRLWDTVQDNIEGVPNGPNEYHTVEYGKLYRKQIIKKIKDKSGCEPVRISNSIRGWKFNEEKLKKVVNSYSTDVKIQTTVKRNVLEDGSVNSVISVNNLDGGCHYDNNNNIEITNNNIKREELYMNSEKILKEIDMSKQENRPERTRTLTQLTQLTHTYRCYHNGCVCGHTCDFETDSEMEYQKHGALNHLNNPLLYPSPYEIKKYCLTPQGKEWEREKLFFE